MTNFGYEKRKVEVMAPPVPPTGQQPVAGKWWAPFFGNTPTGPSDMQASNNRALFWPWNLNGDIDMTSIGFTCQSGAHASSAILVGVYSNDDGFPGEQLGQATVALSSVATCSASLSLSLTAGNYFMGYTMNAQAETSTTRISGAPSNQPPFWGVPFLYREGEAPDPAGSATNYRIWRYVDPGAGFALPAVVDPAKMTSILGSNPPIPAFLIK